MTMSYDPLAYEMPWRPNYEKNAVAGWLAASGAALAGRGGRAVSKRETLSMWEVWGKRSTGTERFNR